MRPFIFPAVFLFTACTVQAQSSFSVAPGRIFFDTKALKKTERLQVFNNGKETASWHISLQDWDRDSTGRKRFYDAGTRPNSCAGYLKIFPATLTVAAGATGEVSISLDPQVMFTDSDTAKTCMIIVSQAENMEQLKNPKQKQAAINIRTEFAIHAYVQNDLAKRSVEVSDFSLSRDTPAALVITLQNSGLLPADARIRIEITDRQTGREWKQQELTAATLPGAVRVSRSPLPPDIGKGTFLALAVIDAGEEMPVKVAELNFELK